MKSNLQVVATYVADSHYRRKCIDHVLCTCIGLSALAALIPLFLVLGYVSLKGVPHLNLSFFTEIPKPVGETGGGMANAVLGSLWLVGLACFVGVLWGAIVGIYLAEYGYGRLAILVRFGTDLLASIPSIIVGLFIYAVIVSPMKRFSAIAGGVALGIIMIPIVARNTEELLRLVPNHIREAGLALGIPRWKVLVRIVLRGCLNGLMTGVILAIARVAGETAPLLFTAFNNHFWSHRLDQPMASLPAQIYSYAISPFEEWQNQAWTGALVLVSMVFVINLAVRFFLSTGQKGHRG